MDKAVIKGHFDADLDEISQDVLNLDIADDSRTFQDTVRQIQAKLDRLVQTKTNLDLLARIFTD